MQAIDEKVISMVYGRGRGIVFTPKLFSGVGDPRAVGVTLTARNFSKMVPGQDRRA
jgi:hypothetical protein